MAIVVEIVLGNSENRLAYKYLILRWD